MNKLFTKIASLALGAAMAFGVGVAVSSKSKIDSANAETKEITPTAVDGTDGIWSFDSEKSSGSNTPIMNNGAIRLYPNNTFNVSTSSDTVSKIDSIVYSITVNGNNKGKIPGQPTSSDGTVSVSGTWSASQSVTVTIDSTASSCKSITFTVSSGQSAGNIHINSFTITYTASGGGTTPTKLSAPTGLSASGTTLTWNTVSNNSGYAYSINTNPETTGVTNTNVETFDASTLQLSAGTYEFQVKAKGDGTNYSDSDYCTAVEFTISGGGGSNSLIITPDYLGLDTTGIGSTTATDLTGTDGLTFNAKAGGSNKVKKQARASTTTNHFSRDGFVLMGKNGAYIYNKTEFDYPIKSFNVVTNGGTISTSVVVAVGFGTSQMTSSLSGGTTLNAADTVFNYDLPDATTKYTYFRIQVTSAHNAQIQIKIEFEEPSTDPELSISTASTSVTRDGTVNQTILFTATTTNFSDDAADIAYEWRSSNTNAISVTSVGSESTANLKVVGTGTAEITCYALGLSGDEATSTGVSVTVTNETYSGSLSITTSGDIMTESEGDIEYTLTGNTHPMNTYNVTSSDEDVIYVKYNSSTGKFEYLAGNTAYSTAIVTITLSSSIYTLETYQASLNVRLVDANAVSSVTTNIETRNVKFGGNSLSFVATVHLVGGGDASGKQVTWTPANLSVCTIIASQDTLTGTVVPVNVGTTTVRVASVDDSSKYHDVTVNVSGPDSKTLNSIVINKGDGYKTTYYDTATNVDLTGLSLTANYINNDYPTYSEDIAVANDASGVTWTLDKTNRLVKVSYIVDAVEKEDSFSITIAEEPSVVTIVSSKFGISNQTDATGTYNVSLFAVTIADNEGTTPKYYSNGSAVRLYSGNTFVITANESVQSIDSIVITVHDSREDFTIGTNTGGDYDGSGLEYTFTDTTEITFTAGSNQFRPVSIEILYTEVQSQDKDVESVSVTPSTGSIESGSTINLSVEVLPVDARDTSVTWESDDETIATVDENGVVTGVSAGTAVITATSNDQDTISDYATITVTAGPIVSFTASSAINNESGSQVYLGNAYFGLTVEGGTYRGSDGRGAQFSSSKTAVDVGFELTDIAVATQDLRVIVDASQNANGTATLGVKLGSTDLQCDSETSVTLTGTSTEYEFSYSGSSSSVVNLSNLVSVSLSNDGGAIYVKSIKVYSAASQSVIGNFTTNSLRMDSYDKGGTEGSAGGNGSCKTWWSDVLSSYNGLTDGQKSLFGSVDEYSSARARLSEWARINGYSFDPTDGTISQSNIVNPIKLIADSGSEVAIIVVTSMIGLSAVGGYFFLRKRKEI